MTTDNKSIAVGCVDSLPYFMTPGEWQYTVRTLNFSPQQARIVSLILQKKQDKQIVAELGLNRSTIRTYLRRVFDRVGVDDRMELVLLVFALCLRRRDEPGVSQISSNFTVGRKKKPIKVGPQVSGSLSPVLEQEAEVRVSAVSRNSANVPAAQHGFP